MSQQIKTYTTWMVVIVIAWAMYGSAFLSLGHRGLRALGNVPHAQLDSINPEPCNDPTYC